MVLPWQTLTLERISGHGSSHSVLLHFIRAVDLVLQAPMEDGSGDAPTFSVLSTVRRSVDAHAYLRSRQGRYSKGMNPFSGALPLTMSEGVGERKDRETRKRRGGYGAPYRDYGLESTVGTRVQEVRQAWFCGALGS